MVCRRRPACVGCKEHRYDDVGAPHRDRWRGPGWPDGGGSGFIGRRARRRVRCNAVGRAQVPARGSRRVESDPQRAADAISGALQRLAAAGGRSRGVRCGGGARLGARTRHRHVRRHLGSRVSDAAEGRAAAARMAASAARSRGRVAGAASPDGAAARTTVGGRCDSRRRRLRSKSAPMRWCSRSAVAAGRDSARMVHGWTGSARRACRSRRCGRRTAGSSATGANICAPISPAPR